MPSAGDIGDFSGVPYQKLPHQHFILPGLTQQQQTKPSLPIIPSNNPKLPQTPRHSRHTRPLTEHNQQAQPQLHTGNNHKQTSNIQQQRMVRLPITSLFHTNLILTTTSLGTTTSHHGATTYSNQNHLTPSAYASRTSVAGQPQLKRKKMIISATS